MGTTRWYLLLFFVKIVQIVTIYLILIGLLLNRLFVTLLHRSWSWLIALSLMLLDNKLVTSNSSQITLVEFLDHFFYFINAYLLLNPQNMLALICSTINGRYTDEISKKWGYYYWNTFWLKIDLPSFYHHNLISQFTYPATDTKELAQYPDVRQYIIDKTLLVISQSADPSSMSSKSGSRHTVILAVSSSRSLSGKILCWHFFITYSYRTTTTFNISIGNFIKKPMLYLWTPLSPTRSPLALLPRHLAHPYHLPISLHYLYPLYRSHPIIR